MKQVTFLISLWMFSIVSIACANPIIPEPNEKSELVRKSPCYETDDGAYTKAVNENQLLPRAKQGSAEAQFSLGNVYYNGQSSGAQPELSIPQDYSKAAIWFEKAADQGVVKAQGELSDLYLQGHGVEQNYKKSYFWALIALDGDKFSREPSCLYDSLRVQAGNKLTPEQKSEVEKLTKAWKPTLAHNH